MEAIAFNQGRRKHKDDASHNWRSSSEKMTTKTEIREPCLGGNTLFLAANLMLVLTLISTMIGPVQSQEVSSSRVRELMVASSHQPVASESQLVQLLERQRSPTRPSNTESNSSELAKRQAEPELQERKASNAPLADSLLAATGNQNNNNHNHHHQSLSATQAAGSSRLHIVRLFAPEAVQNGKQNVTIDCMFKFDKKLDQRLTIKWFFNDELEPIYQWIPELNKRVYSDKYEQFLDKSYQVNEDVDFMLQAYKWLHSNSRTEASNELELISEQANERQAGAFADELAANGQQAAHRSLLANRLNRLAKLGGEHSRQLLASLRASLAMQNEQLSKFRALRLIRPTSELSGRFTCSISSLEADDLQSTRLVVFEPAKSLELSVSRAQNRENFYNLSCSAAQVFPRPTLSLYRRTQLGSNGEPNSQRPTNERHRPPGGDQLHAGRQSLEPLEGVQSQLIVSASRRNAQAPDWTSSSQTSPSKALEQEERASNTIQWRSVGELDVEPSELADNRGQAAPLFEYEICAWTLVDEATLSAAQATQFECLLTIDGAPNFEQRQVLAMQKGWHLGQSPALALARNSTLVGIVGALAALLCLFVALVSAGLIFKLLHKQPQQTRKGRRKVADCSAKVEGVARHSNAPLKCEQLNRREETDSSCSGTSSTNASSTNATGSALSSALAPTTAFSRPGSDYNEFGLATSANDALVAKASPVASVRQSMARQMDPISCDYSDGVYRVPTSLAITGQQQQPNATAQAYAFNGSMAGGRLVIGPARGCWQQKDDYAPHQYNGWNQLHNSASGGDQYQYGQVNYTTGVPPVQQSAKSTNITQNLPATISVNGKQLYC